MSNELSAEDDGGGGGGIQRGVNNDSDAGKGMKSHNCIRQVHSSLNLLQEKEHFNKRAPVQSDYPGLKSNTPTPC